MKKNFSLTTMHSLLLSAVFVLLTFTFSSCNLFSMIKGEDYETLTEFLSRNETEIRIVDKIFPSVLPVDKEGFPSIPSESDYYVTYLIKNPNALPINALVKTAADQYLSPTEMYIVNLPDISYSALTINYTHEMLVRMERGGDISTTINLELNGKSVCEPYVEKLRSNTPPPPVQNACVMIEPTQEQEYQGYYILCFNLPDTLFREESIHSDVKKIYITGFTDEKHKALANGLDLNIDFTNKTFNSKLTDERSAQFKDKLEMIEYLNSAEYKKNMSGTPYVTFNPSEHAVYIRDEGPRAKRTFDKEKQPYTITLEDEKGLRTSITVNPYDMQLNPVKLQNDGYLKDIENVYVNRKVDPLDDGTIIENFIREKRIRETNKLIYGNNVGYFLLNMEAPTQTLGEIFENIPGVEVYYEVSLIDLFAPGIQDYYEGHKVSLASVPLYDDHYYSIKAYAHKDGFIDSEVNTWNITVGNWETVDVEVDAAIRYDIRFEITPLVIKKELFESLRMLSLTLFITDRQTGETTVIRDNSEEYHALPAEERPEWQIYDSSGTLYVPLRNDKQAENSNALRFYLPDYMGIQPAEYTLIVNMEYKGARKNIITVLTIE